MRTLTRLIGFYSPEELRRVAAHTEFLENQPPLEVDKALADKNPILTQRKIIVTRGSEMQYQVIDIGRVNGSPTPTVSLASEMYHETDVEILKYLEMVKMTSLINQGYKDKSRDFFQKI